MAAYVEVYSTQNLEEFLSVKRLLKENGIPCKDTSISNQLRLSFNNMRGDRVALSRGGGGHELYRLAVKKNEEGKAHQILNRRQ